MFISRRQGRPEDHYRVLGILGARPWVFDGFWMVFNGFRTRFEGPFRWISMHFGAAFEWISRSRLLRSGAEGAVQADEGHARHEDRGQAALRLENRSLCGRF